MENKLVLKIFIGFSILYLLIILFGHENIAWYLKPFLIPLLILAVTFSENFPSKKMLTIALLFSWIGDVILMFSDCGELCFIFGLVAFLLSHIVYIIVFNKQQITRTIENKTNYWGGISFILVYFAAMVFTLFPKLGPLKIPVLVYAIVICSMLYFAFKGSFIWTKLSNNPILLGAVFFVTSDSILAFNKFYSPIPFGSFLIMLTYIAAQYFIVNGILKLNQKK
jgi:uncharacterized membrane protein YhhN